jgi:hypothetical protein
MKPKPAANNLGLPGIGPIRHLALAGYLLTVSLNSTSSEIQEEELLSEAFLEFLGGWETASGEWLNPEELVLMPTEKAQPESAQEDEGKTDEDN